MEERIKQIISTEFDTDVCRVTPDAHLMETLGVDSLDLVDLILVLEEEFGIEIPDEEAKPIQTVGDIINLISHKIAYKLSS